MDDFVITPIFFTVTIELKLFLHHITEHNAVVNSLLHTICLNKKVYLRKTERNFVVVITSSMPSKTKIEFVFRQIRGHGENLSYEHIFYLLIDQMSLL